MLQYRVQRVGMSQKALARDLHVAPSTLWNALSRRSMSRWMYDGVLAAVEQREREVLAELLYEHWERG